ncbi:MAG: hypothetical protein M3Y34_03605 [Actinomycetota bacterium]|nr:hypothetical protein [Actinomycetota bacterium]
MAVRAAWVGLLCLIALGSADLGASAGPAETCFGEAATITGTPGNDRIVLELGDRNAVVVTQGGDDRIIVGAKHVRVCEGGGQGYVRIEDGFGVTRLNLGAGRDRVIYRGPVDIGTPEETIVRAGSGADRVFTGGFEDRLFGNEGNDLLSSWRDEDRLSGGAGDDELHAGPESDRMRGGPGRDLLDGDLRDTSDYPAGENDRANGGGEFDRCEAEIVRECEEVGEF